MIDFEVPESKIDGKARKVIDRAVEDARRYGHAELLGEHILLAFAQVEWDIFSEIINGFKLNPGKVIDAIRRELRTQLPSGKDKKDEISPAPATKLIFQLAYKNAGRYGRSVLELSDLFAAIFEEKKGGSVKIISSFGVEPRVFVDKIIKRLSERELYEERLRKRFELPISMRHYSTNLNLLACQNKITPAYGREKEIRQVLEILCHRERPNSVMLIGEPGVGKTAVVEGLAHWLEFEPDRIPDRIRDSQIVNLQMNSMVAGTMLRGMFEERIHNVIGDLKMHPNIILFIDEAHTLIGAGSALGAPADAAQAFKSVLARGEVRMIAATTLIEYKSHIQEDEALARRFRTVHILEPTTEETRQILFSVRPRLERNYSVKIPDEVIDAVLDMSSRYQRHLHLPDKVVGWLDTASVRAEIDRRWEVSVSDIMDVISRSSQIPRDMVCRDVSERFKDIEERLSWRVIGQKKAIKALADRLTLNKGPLKDNFYRPDGVLLFLGPTGVGKTELAKAIAEFLFGDDKKMIRIDMSEYQENAISVNKLIGMPRGIVGSEHGGILTDQLKDNPCSVILLDEIEKASSSVLNLFLTAFDEGWLTDGRGRRVYLSDSIIIMTSNAGSEHFKKLSNPMGFRVGHMTLDQVQSEINRELERRFPPEFRNRIDQVVIFQPLTIDEVREIALKYIKEMRTAIGRWNKLLEVKPEALGKIVSDGYSLAYGARFLKRVIDEKVKLPVSQKWKEGNIFIIKVADGEIAIEIQDKDNKELKGDPVAV